MLLKNAMRAAVSVSWLRRFIIRGFWKGHAVLRAIEDDRFATFFARHKEYTRLPMESFVSNLAVLDRHLNIDGCVVECGVWRGGMSAGMADLLGPDRTYYLFDSFEGLPEAQEIDGRRAIEWQSNNPVDNCRTEEAFAKFAMARSHATRYFLLKGWFSETMLNFKPDKPIAVLRIDADWYSSTAECLNYLYPHVSKGGVILIDDYFVWDGCSRAIHDYLSLNALSDRINSVDRVLAYIIKTDMKELTPIDPNRQL